MEYMEYNYIQRNLNWKKKRKKKKNGFGEKIILVLAPTHAWNGVPHFIHIYLYIYIYIYMFVLFM
jgi:hypothetical protein